MDELREGPLDRNLHLPLARRLQQLAGERASFGLASVVLGLSSALAILRAEATSHWLLTAWLLLAATVAARGRRPRDPTAHDLDLLLFLLAWGALSCRVAAVDLALLPLAAMTLASALLHARLHGSACRRLEEPGPPTPELRHRLFGGSIHMAGYLSPGTHLGILYAALLVAAFDVRTAFGAAVILIAIALNLWALFVASALRRADALARRLANPT